MSKELIKKQRKILGYSQDYVAQKLNISQRAYSKIECGETEPSVERLRQIARVLEIPFSEPLSPT